MTALTDLTEVKSRITGDFLDSLIPETTIYRRLESRGRWRWTLMFSLLSTVLGVSYVVWLIASAMGAGTFDQQDFTLAVAVLALLMELVRLPLVATLAWTATLAKKPIPIRQLKKLDAALVVTFVPKSEDIGTLRRLLIAAKGIKQMLGGHFAIFVLDEGNKDDPTSVQDMIDEVNLRFVGHPVYRISRFEVSEYHQKKGAFETKTKHGNINAGLDYIRKHSDTFGAFHVIMGLDPDHIPMDTFAERMLCYFNDPDVAFVAGPQSYENASTNVVAKLAESQQFVFHSLIQTAANSFGAPMLVGTSYAIRMDVLERIGGIQPSITEDMATSFAILPLRNEKTGNMWKGVYTPDLLAHGEGPSSWGAFYKQQDRWSRGAVEYMLAGPFFKHMFGMWRKPLRILHYTFLMAFYPIMGIVWLLAAANTLLVTIFGASSAIVSPTSWVMFYGWAAVTQVWLYIWTRRHNVSPYETSNSWGAYGMFMSVASAPVYANTLIKAALRRPVGFSVTPKGGQGASDTLYTFRLNLAWVVYYAITTVVATVNGVMTLALLFWPIVAIILAMAPVVLWKIPEPLAKSASRADIADPDLPISVTA